MCADLQVANWKKVLELDQDRRVTHGRSEDLAAAIQRGADLRIMTEFVHGEHVDPGSDSQELIREVCEFQTTYNLADRWTAAIMQLRQPISLPDRFGERPSLSFFLYNEDGQQAIARPLLDGESAVGQPGARTVPAHPEMPKYHQFDNFDVDTNAPSHNFVYDFSVFRYFVRDDWTQVLEHDAQGSVRSGSVDDLARAFASGCQIKIAVSQLCCDLALENAEEIQHEVFTRASSCYYYTDQKLFITGADPVVRVSPTIPLQYSSGGWEACWIMARSDGFAVLRKLNPLTLKFNDIEGQFAMRWFIR